jgi:hypothetical protein
MKLLAKIGVVVALGGAGMTLLYAQPTSGDAAGNANVEQASLILAKAKEDAQHVKQLQQLARQEKDVIKLNCINDKLVQLRPQLNMADSMMAEIRGGSANLDGMRGVGDSIRKLREAAAGCIGEPMLGTDSVNSFTHPPMYDPTGDDGTYGDPLEPPAYASPVN